MNFLTDAKSHLPMRIPRTNMSGIPRPNPIPMPILLLWDIVCVSDMAYDEG